MMLKWVLLMAIAHKMTFGFELSGDLDYSKLKGIDELADVIVSKMPAGSRFFQQPEFIKREKLEKQLQSTQQRTGREKTDQPVLTSQVNFQSHGKTAKDTYVGLIDDTIALMAGKGYLRNLGPIGKILFLTYKFGKDLKKLELEHHKVNCPASYDKVGDLCLSFDRLNETLDYAEARWYCKAIKGGDLIMFRDANDFDLTLDYLQKKDIDKEFSYIVGAADDVHEGHWTYVDGSKVSLKTPFWTVLDTNTADNDCAVLNKNDHWFMHAVQETSFEPLKAIPLCQYIAERDFGNFQLATTLFHDWDHWRFWYAHNQSFYEPPRPQSYSSEHGFYDPHTVNLYTEDPWDKIPIWPEYNPPSYSYSDKSDLSKRSLNKPPANFANILAAKRRHDTLPASHGFN